MKKKSSFLYSNSLSLVMFFFMILFIGGQFYTGLIVYNNERSEEGFEQVSAPEYAVSGHFIQATFENWESEFLQMAFYVYPTLFLRQKGSSESKGLNGKEPVDREHRPHPKAPWPVKKGGLWLKLYSNSLTIVFIILFILSFVLHFYGSLKNYNEEQFIKNETL